MTPDERFMALALRLAARGAGRTSPNPMVGAVLVRDGRVVATGYHRSVGRDHAEVDALRRAGGDAAGCDLYVNLEPCCHFGRTPPCTRAVLAAGVRRVVIAMIDPNPLVSGRGVEALRSGGIAVDVGVLEAEARELNAPFIRWITTGRPRVTLKLASTLDGRIADRTGAARWITSEDARREVHRMRARVDAVMVGSGTARADDPLLLPTLAPAARLPARVVVDSEASLPPTSQLARTADRGPVYVAARAGADPARVAALRAAGVEVIELPGGDGGVDLGAMLRELGKRSMTSVLVEGGSELAAGLLRGHLVDRLVLFLAPKLLGDPDGLPLVGDLGLRTLADSLPFRTRDLRRIGPDVRVVLDAIPL